MEKRDQPGKDDQTDPTETDTIIELTDVVRTAVSEDDELIELTDIAAPEAFEEEAPIELTDVVQTETTPEEEFIELTDMVQAEDEIVELTDVIEPEAAPEDEFIELTDMVQPEAAPEDEPVELTDMVQTEAAPEDEPVELTDMVQTEAAPEYEPFELTDMVQTEAETQDESNEPSDMDSPATPLELFDVIGLSAEPDAGQEEMTTAALDSLDETPAGPEIVQEAPPEESGILEILDLAGQAAAEFSETDEPLADLAGSFLNADDSPADSDRPEIHDEEDITTTIGMKIDTAPEARSLSDLYQNWESAMEDDDEQAEVAPISVQGTDAETFETQGPPPSFEPVLLNDRPPLAATPEQIEEAVAKVIARMLDGKIEEKIVTTIEKAVAKEIERLREALLEDSTDS